MYQKNVNCLTNTIDRLEYTKRVLNNGLACVTNTKQKRSFCMYESDGAAAGGALLAALLIPLIICLVVFLFMMVCYWKIAAKAGYSGALSLLLLIPIVNIIVFIVFAFSKWPVLQELEQRRMQGGFPPNVPMGASHPPRY